MGKLGSLPKSAVACTTRPTCTSLHRRCQLAASTGPKWRGRGIAGGSAVRGSRRPPWRPRPRRWGRPGRPPPRLLRWGPGEQRRPVAQMEGRRRRRNTWRGPAWLRPRPRPKRLRPGHPGGRPSRRRRLSAEAAPAAPAHPRRRDGRPSCCRPCARRLQRRPFGAAARPTRPPTRASATLPRPRGDPRRRALAPRSCERGLGDASAEPPQQR
mmetsp:Transcript_19622/g.54601  ORF Transcript_19622/g.54601 Transcript_19622/m.54601 type:complete len:212 (+) Transcript_19622:13-648(+)